MPKYTVTSPIKFEGKRIEIDATVDMPERIAQPLLAAGALVPAEPAESAKVESKGKGK